MKRALTQAIVLAGLAITQCAQAQSQNWYQQNRYQLENTQRTHELEYMRCTNMSLPADDRIGACKELVNGGSAQAVYSILLGDAYQSKRDYPDAMDAYTHAFNLEASSDALIGRAIVHVEIGEYEKAMADADAIMTLEHGDAHALNARCRIRAIAGKELDAALADCNAAQLLEPRDSAALDSRGLVRFRLGDMKAAIADFDAALAENSKLPSSLYMRGIAKQRSGDSVGAAADMDAARTRNPAIADEFARYGIVP